MQKAIIEIPPQQRTIYYYYESDERIFRLNFPFLIFVVKTYYNPVYSAHLLDSLFLLSSPNSVFKNDNLIEDSPIYHPPLPNIRSDSRVCLPWGLLCDIDLESLREKAINLFWNSAFTCEGIFSVSQYFDFSECSNSRERNGIIFNHLTEWEKTGKFTLLEQDCNIMTFLEQI